MSSTSTFELDPNDVLGFEFQNFIRKQKRQAINNPTLYDNECDLANSIIKQEITKKIFDVLKAFLTKGEAVTSGGGSNLKLSQGPVNYPTQKIHQFVLDIVEDLAEDLDKIIQLVFPDTFGNIADSRLVIKQKGTGVDVATNAP